jgi:UDP-N-acetylglucosamine 4-epimerase
MTAYEKIQRELRLRPRTWLVTGCAGFIGSHLIEKLLLLGQKVVGLDNFSTGNRRNLTQVRSAVGSECWKSFRFIRGDIRKLETCRKAVRGVDYVLHQAALGSVPRSVEDPITTNDSNLTGFLNILIAVRDARVKRFVYASSSSVYGEEPTLPKVEAKTGAPLSPYAATKYMNELYAMAFANCYRLESIGLRYFNVFGPRQDPEGPYAAVIPKWLAAMQAREPIFINGDGETSRDFCFIANVVQINLLAATSRMKGSRAEVYNVACNERTSLNDLFGMLRERLLPKYPHLRRFKPAYKPFRPGDIRHSQADISKAMHALGYAPTHRFADGLTATLGIVTGV